MLAGLLALAACDQAAPEIESVRIRGELVCPDAGTPPPDAVASVRLIELAGDGTQRTLATHVRVRLGQPPIAFALSVARQTLAPDGDYALRAEISDGGGWRWHTPEPVPIEMPLSQARITLRLTPAAGGEDG